MAYVKAQEARAMTREARGSKLKELRGELMHERGVAAMGGSPPSPGKIRQIRRQIARILTIEREGLLQTQGRFLRTMGPEATGATRPAKAAAPASAPKKKGE